MTGEERRRETYLERRRRRKRRRTIQIIQRTAVMCGILLLVILGVVYMVQRKGSSGDSQVANKISGSRKSEDRQEGFRQKEILETPDYQVELLTPNAYSRPQTALEEVKGIVIHYTANPGTTAKQNRDYFESLKDTKETKASSHFVIGMEGEVVQCIPSSEIAYASNDRNSDTLSIECCHEGKDGKFNQATYDSLVEFTAWLCGKFNIPVENIIRHYDVTGKECPLYYVENEDQWENFKQDVQDYLDTHGVDPKSTKSAKN